MTRYAFAFAPSYRLPALCFGITPSRAWVEVTAGEVVVHFGPWRLRSGLANIDSVRRTGGFGFLKTAGPPHLSFADRGVSFATNGDAGVCLTFQQPVAGIDPTRRILHPGATLTLADPEAFLAELHERTGLTAS
ncbi:MAG: hypothetical protein ABI776_09885 [Nocardioidaceae bacterium]